MLAEAFEDRDYKVKRNYWLKEENKNKLSL